MIRDSTQVISFAYSILPAIILCLIEQVFTIVHKSLIFNDLQLLAQLPSEAFSAGGEGSSIGSLHTPLRIDCRGFLHFYTLLTIVHRVLARHLLPVSNHGILG